MAKDIIKLKPLNKYEWGLFAPAGHRIGPAFRGSEYKALEWARKYVSSFYTWTVELEKPNNEQESRILP